MKKLKIKHVISLTVLLVMLAVTLVPAFAASTIGCDWNVGTGETKWAGKNAPGGLWDLGNAGQKRYNISILSNRSVTVNGVLYYVRQYATDYKVLELSVSGANGDWRDVYFNSVYGHGYYANLTVSSTVGANGRTSVTIP